MPMCWRSCRTHPVIPRFARLLRILEEKGHLVHEKDGPRYIYRATQPRHQVGRSALKQIVQTFFDKSVEKTVATLVSDAEISDGELDRLSQLIEQAKKGGKSLMMQFIDVLNSNALVRDFYLTLR